MDRGDSLIQPPGPRFPGYASPQRGDSLADLLERILDKGLMIAGDISVSIVDIELLKIRVRLMITSLEKAEELGIDWWRNDPFYSSRAPRVPIHGAQSAAVGLGGAPAALASPALDELLAGMRALREEVDALRREQAALKAATPAPVPATPRAPRRKGPS